MYQLFDDRRSLGQTISEAIGATKYGSAIQKTLDKFDRPLQAIERSELRLALRSTKIPEAKINQIFSVIDATGISTKPLKPTFTDPSAVYQHFATKLAAERREHFIVLLLDVHHRQIGEPKTIAIGTLTMATCHPREVFKPAIMASAAAILAMHNHPSGDPTPSPEDWALTRRLIHVGQMVGIPLLDHVILGFPDYMSLHASTARWDSLGHEPWDDRS